MGAGRAATPGETPAAQAAAEGPVLHAETPAAEATREGQQATRCTHVYSPFPFLTSWL